MGGDERLYFPPAADQDMSACGVAARTGKSNMRYRVCTAIIAAIGFSPAICADTVELTNGDVLTGKVIEQTDNRVVLTHPVLGEVSLPADQVAEVKLSDPDAPADQPTQAAQIEAAEATLAEAGYTVEPPAPEQPPNPGLKLGPVTLFEGWERRFEVGINGSEGNTVDFNARVALSGFYEDAERRWFVDMVYERASEDNETTENDFYASVTRDWLLPEKKHFYFLTGRYDWDEFQDWDSRVSGAGGIGYQFVKNEKWELLGRAGAGGNQEFGGEDDEFTPEGLLGVNLLWNIADGQSLRFANTYYPDLGDFSQFRNITRVEWKIALDAVEGMSLAVGAENEHQSDPGGDAEKDDLTYYLSLIWDF